MTRVLILLLSSMSIAYADNADKFANAVSDNISSEYASCAAYFVLMSHAVATATDKNATDVAEQYKKM